MFKTEQPEPNNFNIKLPLIGTITWLAAVLKVQVFGLSNAGFREVSIIDAILVPLGIFGWALPSLYIAHKLKLVAFWLPFAITFGPAFFFWYIRL